MSNEKPPSNGLENMDPRSGRPRENANGAPDRDRSRTNGSVGGRSASGATRLCRKCREPLTGQFVRALGGTFHLDCFSCQVSSIRDIFSDHPRNGRVLTAIGRTAARSWLQSSFPLKTRRMEGSSPYVRLITSVASIYCASNVVALSEDRILPRSNENTISSILPAQCAPPCSGRRIAITSTRERCTAIIITRHNSPKGVMAVKQLY